MTSAAWLVGYVTLPDAVVVFDGDDVALAGGTYALRHGTAALSLIDYLNTTLDAAPSAVTCTSLVVLRNRIVQINLSGVATIAWSTGGATATLWAAALGFAATDLTGLSSYEAEEVSPLLFSPGFLATPKTIGGVEGYTVSQQAIYTSDDLSQVFGVHYGDGTFQELGWSHILPERMRVATGTGGGTFHEFYEQCAKLRRRFSYYEEIDEDDASSSAVTWTTAMGPYVLREFDGDWYRRNVSNAELSSSLELPLQLVDEVA